MKNHHTTLLAKLYINEGILYVIANNNQTIEVDHLDPILHQIDNLCQGKKYPFLIETGTSSKISSKARQLIADRFQKYRTAEAIVCKSFYHKILSQLYITINRPANPTKIFMSFEEAEIWLKNNFT